MRTGTFSIGQKVVWDTSRTERVSHPRKQHGEGPFVVVAVKTVPDKCDCGTPLSERIHQEYGCPYGEPYGRPIRQLVGHCQWLEIRTLEGKRLITITPSSCWDSVFSGAWFVPADA